MSEFIVSKINERSLQISDIVDCGKFEDGDVSAVEVKTIIGLFALIGQWTYPM